ncbi:hypothetical protein PCYB_042660 [Plasmodium cynomolgi strain B]|uniref:Uncharacterized protein n=1 Tax=Plasmodium cynomolgi (strain B) TaxID=1120755 RepID=K6V7I4_PLACD|nr:hypothetical protein PCYB_042660 [Plasmodium cynomolgi strain B]GAB65062.1 hypothetical protein PCYB_042660 [Plasmodium cynomolgi strain B]
MNLYLNVLHEIEAILQRCNGDVYQKVRKIIEYIRRNYREDQEEVVAPKKGNAAKKKRANSRRRDEKDTSAAKQPEKLATKQTAKLTTKLTAKQTAKLTTKQTTKQTAKLTTKQGENANSIKNYFKVGSPNGSAKDFIIHSNKSITHIMCPQLKDNDFKGLNQLAKEILTYKVNSLHIFIVESFDSLNDQFRKIIMNKMKKSKNLIFIHSTVCLNDIYLANCLYVRIPKPDKHLFISHFLHLSQDKYKMDIHNKDRKEYLENIISSCNYDISLILTMLYFIKLNNFPELKKIIKLILNTNIKKLVCIIHKCVISKNSLFLIRNILYSILYTYNFDMHNFFTIFCKQLISFHKDDDNYKKEIFSLFSEYSYYTSLHDNHICSLESLASKVILVEQKYITTLNPGSPISEDKDELSTSFQSEPA